jgi:DNA-binding beta-propeller fold protein YncE
MLAQAEQLASFEDARSVAVDQVGRLYVLDAAPATLTVLSAEGQVLNIYGGAGQGEYEFDDPHEVELSGGLILVVADAGNNQIKRFSSEFFYLESLGLDLNALQGGTAGYRGTTSNEDASLAFVEGRPVAVAVTLSEEVYAIDEEQGVVVKWDADRRVERVFGGFDAGAGALFEPVAVAAENNGSVFVADRKQNAVLVYDRFGTYIRTMGGGLLTNLRALTIHRDRLLVVLPDQIRVYETRGRLIRTYGVNLKEPLVDVTVADPFMYLLTRKALYKVRP